MPLTNQKREGLAFVTVKHYGWKRSLYDNPAIKYVKKEPEFLTGRRSFLFDNMHAGDDNEVAI